MSATKAKDDNFPVRFVSSLGDDLLVGSMTGEEQMGRLFAYQLELLSPNYELQFDDVVGQQVTVVLVVANGERYFNGFITEFVFAGISDHFARYQATVRPWFWFLTRTADCQIFQNLSVPDIIKNVFRDNGMKDFEENLSGTYRKFDYCVQYRESDFNFISRLMEQEGIYYFFKHEADKHILVMADNVSAHQPFPGYNKVTFHSESFRGMDEMDDHLDAWTTRQLIMPDRYAVQDFNFEAPKVPLLKKAQDDSTHAYPLVDSEVFDYPGEYPGPADGENYVEIRLQELKCQKDTVQGGGPCRGMSAGCWFTFEDYPREDQNGDYLVTSVSHHIDNQSFISGEGRSEEVYRCQIGVISKLTRFRSARKTPKPMVQGPQTAIVVGPAGEEIHTDKYGRVIVQFHWDRYGKKDQNSSCWVRVSQAWAGAKWGGIHTPRIGQEVIVSFMEGDPDQPIITGRVYNFDCMPPYALEANKTQSGIKSRSTKGGGPDNFNEIRMEDKLGEEELYIQAEKNENIFRRRRMRTYWLKMTRVRQLGMMRRFRLETTGMRLLGATRPSMSVITGLRQWVTTRPWRL